MNNAWCVQWWMIECLVLGANQKRVVSYRSSRTQWVCWRRTVTTLTNVIPSNLNSSTARDDHEIFAHNRLVDRRKHATEFIVNARCWQIHSILPLEHQWNGGEMQVWLSCGDEWWWWWWCAKLTIQHLDHTRLARNPFNYYWNSRWRCAAHCVSPLYRRVDENNVMDDVVHRVNYIYVFAIEFGVEGLRSADAGQWARIHIHVYLVLWMGVCLVCRMGPQEMACLTRFEVRPMHGWTDRSSINFPWTNWISEIIKRNPLTFQRSIPLFLHRKVGVGITIFFRIEFEYSTCIFSLDNLPILKWWWLICFHKRSDTASIRQRFMSKSCPNIDFCSAHGYGVCQPKCSWRRINS